jgi:phage-related minor tail protein
MAGGSNDVTQFFENIQNAANKVRTEGLDKFGEAMDDMFNAVPVTTAQDFVAGLIEDLRAAGDIADEEAKRIKEVLANTAEAGATQIQAASQGLSESLADYKSNSEELLSTFSGAVEKLGDDLATAVLEGGSVMDGLKDMFKTMVKEMIAQALRLAIIQPILSSIFGAFGYGVSFTGSGGIAKMFKLPAQATGGPVMKNRPYLVGEMGPEVFTPHGAGTISNAATSMGMGGGGVVNYNIQAVDAMSFKQLVARDPEFIYNVTRIGQRRMPA